MAKTKMPSSIRVGYLDYNVSVVPQAELDADHIMDGPPGSTMGVHSFKKKHIKVSKDYDAQMKAGILLHEVFHACLAGVSIDVLNKTEEETVVVELEKVFASIIKDNPKLMTYFMENL